MSALPNQSIDQFVKDLLRITQEYVNHLSLAQLRFFDGKISIWKDGLFDVDKDSIMNTEQAIAFIQKLVDEKKTWINLGGVGWLTEEEYLVSINYSHDISQSDTGIIVTGPSCSADGLPWKKAGVRLV